MTYTTSTAAATLRAWAAEIRESADKLAEFEGCFETASRAAAHRYAADALDGWAASIDNGGGCCGCRKGAYLTNANTRVVCHICHGTGISDDMQTQLGKVLGEVKE